MQQKWQPAQPAVRRCQRSGRGAFADSIAEPDGCTPSRSDAAHLPVLAAGHLTGRPGNRRETDPTAPASMTDPGSRGRRPIRASFPRAGAAPRPPRAPLPLARLRPSRVLLRSGLVAPTARDAAVPACGSARRRARQGTRAPPRPPGITSPRTATAPFGSSGRSRAAGRRWRPDRAGDALRHGTRGWSPATGPATLGHGAVLLHHAAALPSPPRPEHQLEDGPDGAGGDA
jgi:hypothetical protein